MTLRKHVLKHFHMCCDLGGGAKGFNRSKPTIDDICGKARSTCNHPSCTKIHQQCMNVEWKSYLANVAAKRVLGRRA